MSDPVSRFSQLSLESMPLTTASAFSPDQRADLSDHSESEYTSDTGSESSLEDDDPRVVPSPAGLRYVLDHLPSGTRSIVQNVFDEPPKIALQKCRFFDSTYGFEMVELVPRSVRIQALADGSSQLRCTCGNDEEPCGHLLWLLDRIAKQTINGHNMAQPLVMTSKGHAEEMGDPFQSIASHHIGILAEELHCTLASPDLESVEEVESYRARKAHELLSSVHGLSPKEYRPDLLSDPFAGDKVVSRGDLDYTIFRMLLDDDHFFNYFLSLAQATDPFREQLRRVDRVIGSLDASASSPRPAASPEASPDVAWAAAQLLNSVQRIKREIFMRDLPLEADEAISAARTLTHILDVVVAHDFGAHRGSTRSVATLYSVLVEDPGRQDREFVIEILNFIPEAASQFLTRLEAILAQIETRGGAPASYVAKFETLLGRLRASGIGSGLKRQGTGQATGRQTKRMK